MDKGAQKQGFSSWLFHKWSYWIIVILTIFATGGFFADGTYAPIVIGRILGVMLFIGLWFIPFYFFRKNEKKKKK